MTKSTITRERLEELAAGQSGFNLRIATHEESQELARMALSTMDSEPVAEVVSIYGDPEAFGEREIRPLVGIQQMPYGTKLYRHAQQPVVESEPVAEVLSNRPGNDTSTIDMALPVGTQLYRHAQTAQVVPQDVLEALQKVARIRLDLNDFDGDCRGIADCLGDAEEALIEVVNRRAAMLRAGNHSGDINEMAHVVTLASEGDIQAVNSPVIPDGYVMVPKEMTDEIGEAISMRARCCGGIALDIYDAMLAAAPQEAIKVLIPLVSRNEREVK